jgi:hypothetical protein
MPRKQTPSAKLKAWQAVDRLFAKWDAEGWPEYEPDYDELSDRPTLSTLEAHDAKYTDAAQLAAWRQERG